MKKTETLEEQNPSPNQLSLGAVTNKYCGENKVSTENPN